MKVLACLILFIFPCKLYAQLEQTVIKLPSDLIVEINGIETSRVNPYIELRIFTLKDASAVGLIYPNNEGAIVFVITDTELKQIANSNNYDLILDTYEATKPSNSCRFNIMDQYANPRIIEYQCEDEPGVKAIWKLYK